ncbi:hypothetical protein NIES2100_53220 [Calothrix sp. NIES-2100]|uniref:CHAT domain-containing protein n=1 Tax=Calothrix sp. NIES-2100 TaxID=1954172 RepID=UPI000B5E1674|nr:hypothetical protein NIES2100_53220 [Calothrix sp. NIES-2100]
MADPSVLTILFLAANPAESSQSHFEQEARDISDGLQRAKHRDSFRFEQRWAVRPRDIQRAMLDLNPQIIHFSGHGTGDKGLVFEDEIGNAKLVDGDALAGLFELFADQIRCVVLNGCYSQVQAHAIAQHIDYAIGMNQEISDRAAIEFAVGFYDGLGAGRPIEFAYKLGCAAIRMAGLPDNLTPILYEKPELDAISQPNDSAILETNPLNSTTQKTSSKRHTQEKLEDLEEEYEGIRKKLKCLKKERTIKTDSEAKYELDQRIEEYEEKLQNIEVLLEQLEKKSGQN